MLGLVSLGYMFTKKKNGGAHTAAGAHAVGPRLDELPARRRYEPQRTVQDVRTQELLRAQDAERAAKYPMQTGAVDPRARLYTDASREGGTVRSDLAGVDFEAADFRHNNMQPFFGSTVKNVWGGDNQALIERFTGAPGVANSQPKREVPALFAPEERTQATNVYGNQNYADILQGRLDNMNLVNNVRANELPFEQVRVGPGVGQGYTAAPAGGFGQNQDRDFALARYKDVDELRPGNKPKANLEGRLNAGAARTASRGLIGQAAKNKPDTAFDVERFGDVPTRSAGPDGQTGRPDPLHGKKLRSPPTAFRLQPAGTTGARAQAQPVPVTAEQASRVGAPRLAQEAAPPTGAGRAGAGDHAREDMHRAFSPPGENERGRSQALWSAPSDAAVRAGPPGAVHVPGRDVRAHVEQGLRLSGREHTSDAGEAHAFGMMAPQAPARGPAYDPLLHRPRTTVKETQIHDSRLGSYKNEQGQVAGEGSATRRTVREGAAGRDYDTFGVRNPQPPRVQEGVGAPDADPRDHDLRTTAKQLTVGADPLGGVAPSGAAAVAPGGYDVAAAGLEEPRLTNRQFTEQTQYYGLGGRPDRTGYGVADDAMRKTMHTGGGRTDFEYFGIPRSKNDKGVDYAAVYATTLNEAKQALLQNRVPGGHAPGGKRAPDAGSQGEVFARVDDPYVTDYLRAPGNLPKERGGVGSVAFQDNTGLHHDDRIDSQLLSYLRTNPLVINPASAHHAAGLQ